MEKQTTQERLVQKENMRRIHGWYGTAAKKNRDKGIIKEKKKEKRWDDIGEGPEHELKS